MCEKRVSQGQVLDNILIILSAEVSPKKNLRKALYFKKIGEVLVLEDHYELV